MGGKSLFQKIILLLAETTPHRAGVPHLSHRGNRTRMDELFLQQPYPQGRGKRTDMEHTPDHEDEAGSLEAEILDSHLIGSSAEETRTMPIVRVLTGMLLNELMAWTVTLLATLVIPLFVTSGGGVAGICLVLLVLAIVTLALCYGVMVECRRYKHPPVYQFLIVLHASIAVLCVCSAVLIHPLATLCFVLMVWTGTLAMLLKLVHTPAELNAMQLVLLSLYSSIVVCFVCVAQVRTFFSAWPNTHTAI